MIADILNIYMYLKRNDNNFLIVSREITITKVHVHASLFFFIKNKNMVWTIVDKCYSEKIIQVKKFN